MAEDAVRIAQLETWINQLEMGLQDVLAKGVAEIQIGDKRLRYRNPEAIQKRINDLSWELRAEKMRGDGKDPLIGDTREQTFVSQR